MAYTSLLPGLGSDFNAHHAAGAPVDMRECAAVTFFVYADAGDQTVTLYESTGDTGEQALPKIERVLSKPGAGGTWTETTQAAASTYTHADATNDLIAFTVLATQLSAGFTHCYVDPDDNQSMVLTHGLVHAERPEDLNADTTGTDAYPIDDADPGLAYIQDNATAWYNTTDLTTSSQEIVDQLGNHANAILGNTTGVDVTDPAIYVNDDHPIFQFSSNDGNYIDEDTPRAYAITTSLSITVDFGTTGLQVLNGFPFYGIADNTSLNRLIMVHQGSNRQFDVFYNEANSGDSGDVQNFTIPLGTRYVRAIAEVGVGVYMQYSNDKTSWTDSSAAGTVTATTTNANWRLRLGHSPYSTSAGENDGELVGVSAELDGTEVRRIDAQDNTTGSQTSFTSTYGINCTINRSSSGYKVVYVPAGEPVIQTEGTSQYIQLPATLTPTTGESTGEFVVLMIQRVYSGAASANQRWFSSEAGNGTNGYLLYTSNSTDIRAYYHGGTASTVDATYTQPTGTAYAVGLKHVTGSLYSYLYGSGFSAAASTAGDGDAAHDTPRLFVRANNTSNAATLDWFSIVVFTEDVTEANLDLVSAYLIGLAE